jgi:hypothetical protein
MHDWAAALDLTLGRLDDAAHYDLQPEAAVRLASIFAQLAQADERAAILEVMQSRPAAVARLERFLSKASLYRSHPLRYLGDFLGERLNFKPSYDQPSR